MALSDGDFSVSELKMLYSFAAERGVDKGALDKLLMTEGVIDVPGDIETKVEYLVELVRMIWADNKVDAEERAMLQKYARRFGFLDENIPELTEYLLEAVNSGKGKMEILNELQG